MLRTQAGIHSVQVALLAERGVVEYDPNVWDPDKIVNVSAYPLPICLQCLRRNGSLHLGVSASHALYTAELETVALPSSPGDRAYRQGDSQTVRTSAAETSTLHVRGISSC